MSTQVDWRFQFITLWKLPFSEMETPVILPFEAESFIESMRIFPLKDVGSAR